jgi:nitronate monooxygenase
MKLEGDSVPRASSRGLAIYHRGMIHTRFTEMFGLQHPVMSAPMAMHCGGTLAAAVSAAGGMGSFGGIHATEGPDWVSAQAALVRDLTDRPFAIGFITPFLPFAEGHFQAALDAHPDAIALSFSDPSDWARRVKDAGLRLICQAQRFDDADLAVEAGADVLVAQGTEAGGHTGTMSLLPLLVGIAERHPDVTLLAAGGMSSGRTLAAALLAGADGAWLGTAFLATPEAIEVGNDYRAAIVASDGGDTVLTSAYDIASGLPWPSAIGARVRRDAFTEQWAEREADLRQQGDTAMPGPPVYIGQSAHFVDVVRPAADVVRLVSNDAERVLRERPVALVSG